MSLANEEAMMLIIPAARAAVSKILKNDQGMTQAQIAKILGTTQATVSKYLSGKYSIKIKRMEAEIGRDGSVTGLAELIEQGADAKRISSELDSLARRKILILSAFKILGANKH